MIHCTSIVHELLRLKVVIAVGLFQDYPFSITFIIENANFTLIDTKIVTVPQSVLPSERACLGSVDGPCYVGADCGSARVYASSLMAP